MPVGKYIDTCMCKLLRCAAINGSPALKETPETQTRTTERTLWLSYISICSPPCVSLQKSQVSLLLTAFTSQQPREPPSPHAMAALSKNKEWGSPGDQPTCPALPPRCCRRHGELMESSQRPGAVPCPNGTCCPWGHFPAH